MCLLFRIQFNCNEHSIQSFRFFTRTWSTTFAIRNKFVFSLFSAGKRRSCSTHWSPVLKAPSAPSITKFQVVARYKTRNTERRFRDTAPAAAVTAATSDRQGTLAAVGLSLLWSAFPSDAIAMVASGIKHSWSPTRVCALNETSSTGRPRNLVSES